MPNDLQIIQELKKRLGVELECKTINNKIVELYIYYEVIKPKDLQLIGMLTNLKVLYLNHNKISKIEGLDKLTKLEWLSFRDNEITKIQGLDSLTNLKGLSLGENKISKIEGLNSLVNLKELYLWDNPIPKSQINQFKKQNPNIKVYA